MEFESFKDVVKKEVENRVGENCTVNVKDTAKNNGVTLSGLTVKSKDSNIAPIIYLDDYYQLYESGYVGLEAIISIILKVYEESNVDHIVDMSQLLNYESIRKKIVYKLINSEKNTELLQHVPHITFHDLSIVFQISVSEEPFGDATILIHNKHLAIWNVSLDTLYEDARNNTPILNRYEIEDIEDVIRELMPTAETVHTPVPLLVLSNKDKFHGAACILYPDLLRQVSDAIDSSMYIIPSSVHETLLLPAKKAEEAEYKYIKNIISEVNNTRINEEEILSYSVYFYDRNTDEIIIL